MNEFDGLTPANNDNTPFEKLSKTDIGPLLLFFSLFIVGFCLFAGGMILIISGWRLVLGIVVLIGTLGGLAEAKERRILYNQKRGSKVYISKERMKLIVVIGWWLPQEYRDAILGDIMEDCVEMRKAGCTERRIKFHVVYQWLIAVITLVPVALKTSIINAIKQVMSPTK